MNVYEIKMNEILNAERGGWEEISVAFNKLLLLELGKEKNSNVFFYIVD